MRQFVALLFVTLGSQLAFGQLADGYLETWLPKRIQDLESRFSARPFDSVGWADTIVQAAELAKICDRPIFLFTLDGHMDTGRC